jgi:Golgi nucleoside diphosphatase
MSWPYFVIIDAGSSGSRVQIYEIQSHTQHEEPLPHEPSTASRLPIFKPAMHPTKQEWQMKIEPGKIHPWQA